MKITVIQCAIKLGISDERVRFLIASGRLRAERIGKRMFLIDSRDLRRLKIGKVGRPRKGK